MHVARLPFLDTDLGPSREIRPAAIARLFQQAAIEASSAAGFTSDWYAREGTMWIVRRTTIDLARPIVEAGPVEISTWVDDVRRVRSLRRYEMRTSPGAEPVARAETDWVYLDTVRGRPIRVPEAMAASLLEEGAGGARERAALRLPERRPDARDATRVVELRDLDALAHVNNTAYVDFAMETLPGEAPRLRALDIEYLREAKRGERLDVATWPAEGSAWACEIRRGGEELVRALLTLADPD